MHQDLHTAAQALREELVEGGAEARRQLTLFADRFAVTRSLFHRAVLMGREFRQTDTVGQVDELRSRALDLVGQIVADHEAHADSEAARQREEKIEAVRSRLSEQGAPREVVFSCERLGKTYPKSDFTLAGVDLELRQGEITGVVGRNGNGKTTLFRIVAGELYHDRGSLNYPLLHEYQQDGLHWAKIKEHLAYVPQELPKWYGSLHNNLLYEAAIHGIRGQEAVREVDFIVERLDLRDFLGHRWKQLAGGYKMRFALARALVWKPKLLILDEPLANLDFKTQQVVLKDLRNLTNSLRYPLAVLISSQHLHEVEVVSDNMLFLRQGKVVFNGPRTALGEDRKENVFEVGVGCDLQKLKEVLADMAYRQIYHSGVSYVIRTPLDLDAAVLLRTLLAAGVDVEYFRDISRSSKQLFEEAEDTATPTARGPLVHAD